MKKLVKLFLCGLLIVSALAACTPKEDTNKGGNDQLVENIDTTTVGGLMHKAFMTYTTANTGKTAFEIAEELATTEGLPFAGLAMEIEEGYLTGFDNAEITGFESGAMFAPAIGVIPFVGYVFTLGEGADVETFKTTLKENANLRWNICTAAEQMTVESNGNTVFFLMSPMAFEETQEEAE